MMRRCKTCSTRAEYLAQRLIAPAMLIAPALLIALPGAASAHFVTDLSSEEAMSALAHGHTATPLNRRLDVATIRIDQPIGHDRFAGRARLAFDFEHAAPMVIDAYDRIGHAEDHFSFALMREIYVGGSLAYPLTPATSLFAGAGTLRTDLQDRSVAGDPFRNRMRELTGWRLSLGAEHHLGQVTAGLEYRLSRTSDTKPGEAMALASSARGRLMLGLKADF